jgi:hypothetical protein
VILPDDVVKMSKHVGVHIIHFCDIYFFDINCAFLGIIIIIIIIIIKN